MSNDQPHRCNHLSAGAVAGARFFQIAVKPHPWVFLGQYSHFGIFLFHPSREVIKDYKRVFVKCFEAGFLLRSEVIVELRSGRVKVLGSVRCRFLRGEEKAQSFLQRKRARENKSLPIYSLYISTREISLNAELAVTVRNSCY